MQVYPIDERYWLMATAYNTGIECFQYVAIIPCLPSTLLCDVISNEPSVSLYWKKRSAGLRRALSSADTYLMRKSGTEGAYIA